MNKLKNKIKFIALGLISVVILSVLISVLGCKLGVDDFCNIKYNIHSQDFNSQEWKKAYLLFKENKEGYDGTDIFKPLIVHKGMAYSLVRDKSLIGKTKNEVISIIGLEENDVKENKWIYWIDFTISDNLWLELVFHNNKVISSQIRED